MTYNKVITTIYYAVNTCKNRLILYIHVLSLIHLPASSDVERLFLSPRRPRRIDPSMTDLFLGIILERKLVSMQNFIRLFCAQLGMKRHRLIAEQICFYGHFSEVLILSFEGLIFWICLYVTKRIFSNKCFISILAISFTSTLPKLFRSGNSSRE